MPPRLRRGRASSATRQLGEPGATGEVELVQGLGADLRGNRRAAAEHFIGATTTG